MEFNDSEPQGAYGSGPDYERSIMDSFQQVLDALDAARAELLEGVPSMYGIDEGRSDAARRSATERSPGVRGRSVGSGAPLVPEPSLSLPPQQPDNGFDDWNPFQLRKPRGATRSTRGSAAIAVEPLWERDTHADPESAGTGERVWAADGSVADELPPVDAPHTGSAEPGPFPGNTPHPREQRGAAAHEDAASPITAGANSFPWPTTSGSSPTSARPGVRARGGGGPRLGVKSKRLVGVCGVGAVGGLIAVSSLLPNDLGSPEPPVQPSRPLPGGADASSPDDARSRAGVPDSGRTGQDVPKVHEGRLRIPHVADRDLAEGHYNIRIQAGAARFQDLSGRA